MAKKLVKRTTKKAVARRKAPVKRAVKKRTVKRKVVKKTRVSKRKAPARRTTISKKKLPRVGVLRVGKIRGVSKGDDKYRSALKPGLRRSKSGGVYYESRANRSDVTGRNTLRGKSKVPRGKRV